MTPKKICDVVEMYRARLEAEGIPKARMDIRKSFADLTLEERLAHAHHLIDGVLELAYDPEKKGKTGRHLASIQMILSFAGWYTLEQLMDHNRPS